MVISVRRACPSLWYCLTLDFLYSTCSEGTTPSVRTRVRKRPGVRRETRRAEIRCILTGRPRRRVSPRASPEKRPAGGGRSRSWGGGDPGFEEERQGGETSGRSAGAE